MIRRSHKKSRHGCGGCKRRHIKCDESRPFCVNCSTARLKCSYNNEEPNDSKFINYAPDDQTRSNSSNGSDCSPAPLTPFVNIMHLEFFNHFLTNKETFSDDEFAQYHRPLLLKYMFSFPFLASEILATSAMHIAFLNIENATFYRSEAARLQADALRLFNDSIKEITADNLVPSFLFAGVLGVHSLCDVLCAPIVNVEDYWNRLVHAMKLMQGIRTIFEGKWDTLRESEVGILIQGDQGLAHTTDEAAEEFEKLRERLSSVPNWDDIQSIVLDEAVAELQKVYTSHMVSRPLDKLQFPRMATNWPIMIPGEFADLIAARKPQALIVLAYYAVVLHHCRSSWCIKNGGSSLLSTICAYLGSDWESWLAWPRSVVFEVGKQDGGSLG